MKKLLFLFCFIATTIVSFGQQAGVRYNIVPEGGGPFVLVNSEIQTLTYASTKAVATTHAETIMQFASLTGAITINATVTDCYKGDKLYCQFATDGTARVVTFGTNFVTSSTLTIPASSWAESVFLFNGAKWVEVTRQSILTPSFTTITTNAITEATSGQGINFNKQTFQLRTATTYTATGSITVTAGELAGGLLVAATSTATTTFTLPTAAQIVTQTSATAGTTFEFVLVNNGASNGTVTVAVGTGITASDFPGTNTLTRTGSATVGVAVFRLTFLTTSAAVLTRIG